MINSYKGRFMELSEKSVVELRNMAKVLGIPDTTKMKKSELIYAIQNVGEPASVTKGLEEKVAAKEEAKKSADEPSDEEILDNQERYNLTSDTDTYTEGILEILPDGYGFLRGDNYLSTSKDVYVSPVQIKRFRLDTGDRVKGIMRTPKETEKFPALIYVGEVNGEHPENAMKRKKFDELIPIYPNEKLRL